MNNILLIEDDAKKVKDISSFISEKYKNVNLVVEKSFRGGLKQIYDNEFDLLLIDMTIPKWGDNISGESIEYESFGGFNIMKEMKRKKRIIPSIMITMFNEFGVEDSFISLESIDNLCKSNFEFYKGLVYYTSKNEEWMSNLEDLL
ncbi:hypothetical protein [Winogradskyella luteola]|uniref:Response regulatory domain-containing protein n=1 Tax=Winogradskyella luteola TaxID=2828330 RepID=A0A9X1F7U4_9FLAO|nr:hypothetical protein [Winogradskyella luteola]MBV7268950.1 hypothetical protein [Winogradskyella luteola]